MDEETFRVFYEQTHRNIREYLRSMLTGQDIVDDLLQESYFRFMKAGLPAATELAHQRNYLYRIATNLVHDHRRSRKSETLSEERLPATSTFGAFETGLDVGRAFDHLKPRERDLLWFAYVECFDHKEIAGILRVGIASIRPMLARARARFADVLRRRCIGEHRARGM
jgi:RNA polymerase sigma-70 factor (ECF subfamily)